MTGGVKSDLSYLFNDIWQLDLDSMKWAKLSQVLPRGIFYHAAAITPVSCGGGFVSQ